MPSPSASSRKFASLRLWLAALCVLVACSHDAPPITGAAAVLPLPVEPAGFTLIATSDFPVFPWDSTIVGRASGGANPSSLETIVPASSLSVSFAGLTTHVLQHIIEAGTHAGDSEKPGDYAGFEMWTLGMVEGANGGPSDTEYSAIYHRIDFCFYGNGKVFEVPGNGVIKLGYYGVANNNQNPSGPGPTQLIPGLEAVVGAQTAPYTASEFQVNMYMQQPNGNRNLEQNLNLSKHVIVGQVHRLEIVARLNDVGAANGHWDWWLDGIHIGSYSDARFIDPSFAGNGGNGLSGFWGWQFTPWWGGSGGADKTRNDVIYLGTSYISGVFLRNRL